MICEKCGLEKAVSDEVKKLEMKIFNYADTVYRSMKSDFDNKSGYMLKNVDRLMKECDQYKKYIDQMKSGLVELKKYK